MTFLNPLVLIGLVAAAIPVLLHLLNLRKLKTIDFSTIRFLEELQRTKIRRLKLRQWLLMVLRTLLVILLVGAFARPSVQRDTLGDVAADARTSGVILIDDSFSMTGSDALGPYLSQARNIASTVSTVFRDGDDLSVMRFSQFGRRGTTMHPLPEVGKVPPADIRDISPNILRVGLTDVLRGGLSLLENSRNIQKEIFVISDFQQTLFDTPRRRDLGTQFAGASETMLYLLPIGSPSSSNLSFDTVMLESAIIEQARPFSVRTRVTNHSQTGSQKTVVSIYLNGTRVGAHSQTLDAESTADVTFSVLPQQTGFLEGMVEIEEDDLPFDNRAFFALRIPDTRTIVLVGQSAELQYLTFALRGEGNGPRILVRAIPWSALESTQLTDVDALILVNPGALSTGQAAIVRRYVESGGGLMLFAGPNSLPESFNTTVAERIGLPTISGLSPRGRSDDGSPVFSEFDVAELRHPLFQGVFQHTRKEPGSVREERTADTETVPIESPRVRSFARFVPTVSSATIIRLTGGNPFLLEERIGSGKALLFAVPPTEEWSDFPLRGIFVPLIFRSVAYVSQEQSKLPILSAGEVLPLENIPPGTKRVVLRSPDGQEQILESARTGGVLEVGADKFFRTGIYDVRADDRLILKIAVNNDPRESDPRRASSDFMMSELTSLGFQEDRIITIQNRLSLTEAVLQSRFGAELWVHFLIAALAVAVAEMFVARSSRREAEHVSRTPTQS